MHTAYHDYTDGDVTCEAYIAYDPKGPAKRPAVLVVHDWSGQQDAHRGKAEALAQLGYIGIAIDVYGKGKRGNQTEDNSALMAPFMADRALLRHRLLAAVTMAKAQPMVDATRLAAIGYCFGGLCALDIARTATPGIKGAVSIHGIFAAPGLGPQAPITAKVLILHGYNDPFAPPADVLAVAKELTDAQADWQLHAYGHTMHAFTSPGANLPKSGMQYNADADRRSSLALQNFLAEALA